MQLQQHDFIIKHQPGKANTNANALSRMNEIPVDTNEVSCFMINEIKDNFEDNVSLITKEYHWNKNDEWQNDISESSLYSSGRPNPNVILYDDGV